MSEPAGYRLVWRPGEPVYLNPADYAREVSREGADVWALFTEPQTGCSPEIEVYYGWCWVRPKYVSAVCDLTDFTPLYRGPLIQRGTMHTAVYALFPRFLENHLYEEPCIHVDESQLKALMAAPGGAAKGEQPADSASAAKGGE